MHFYRTQNYFKRLENGFFTKNFQLLNQENIYYKIPLPL